MEHLRPRNIEISEKKKHVEDLKHDVRHGYIIINIIQINKYNYRKIIAAVRLGGLAPARPIIVDKCNNECFWQIN